MDYNINIAVEAAQYGLMRFSLTISGFLMPRPTIFNAQYGGEQGPSHFRISHGGEEEADSV